MALASFVKFSPPGFLWKRIQTPFKNVSVHNISSLGKNEKISCSASSEVTPKAAALIIGNEILSGKIQDTNTTTLAKMLFSRGVDLVRAEVVRDVREEITESVLRLSSIVGENGFVFTSGGIGPTHDDITYDSIASAFGKKTALHKETVEKMTTHYESQGKVLNESRLKMATLPEGSEILASPGLWVPLVVVNNVYVLPGIPSLFFRMLDANKERFKGPQFSAFALFTELGEGDLAQSLTEIAEKYPTVSIGSYPSTKKEDDFTTRLTFEGRDKESVLESVLEAKQAISCFREEELS